MTGELALMCLGGLIVYGVLVGIPWLLCKLGLGCD